MMKAVYINEYGGAENLIYGDLEKPEPGQEDVLIRVHASSVNPVDWKVREGRLKFLSGKKFPLIVGSEITGTIEQCGGKVNSFKVGDRVFAGLSHKGGACAEYVAVNQNKVSQIPGELDFKTASTLAIAGVTPLQAFTLHTKVGQGSSVLVNGASGGVGMYAVQIAKILGARVTAVCSAKNAEFVKKLGADEVIDYNEENFLDRRSAFDVILDAASNAFFPEAKGCLKKGGTLIKLNLSFSSLLRSAWSSLFMNKNLKMILLKNRAGDLQWIMDHILKGDIKVHIDREYSLEQVREAHEYSESGRVRGKLVIKII